MHVCVNLLSVVPPPPSVSREEAHVYDMTSLFIELFLEEWSTAKANIRSELHDDPVDVYIREHRLHNKKSGTLLIQNIVVSFQKSMIIRVS